MGKSINARLAALEARELRNIVAKTAAECGLEPDELLEEARAFFRLSLADQLTEVDRLGEDMPASEIEAIKETLTREYRP